MTDEAKPTKACPMCGETILAAAIKCKHCGERLDQQARPNPYVAPPNHVQPAPQREPEFRPVHPPKKSTWSWMRWVVFIIVVPIGAIAWGLGPAIDPGCTAFYNGSVECRFRNRGYLPGGGCAEVSLTNNQTKKSTRTTVCSDTVWPQSDQQVKGLLTEVDETCAGSGKWTEICQFDVRSVK